MLPARSMPTVGGLGLSTRVFWLLATCISCGKDQLATGWVTDPSSWTLIKLCACYAMCTLWMVVAILGNAIQCPFNCTTTLCSTTAREMQLRAKFLMCFCLLTLRRSLHCGQWHVNNARSSCHNKCKCCKRR